MILIYSRSWSIAKCSLTGANYSLVSMKMNFGLELIPESLVVVVLYVASQKLNLLNSASEFFVEIFRRQTRAE